ncbi:TPA: hypothetical protein ACH1VU_006247 [Pseudomonas aeruginosa]
MNQSTPLTVPNGELLKCPHCSKAQESPVEDYVVPGRVGSSSATKEQCEHCDEWFTIECVAPGSFIVTKTQAD